MLLGMLPELIFRLGAQGSVQKFRAIGIELAGRGLDPGSVSFDAR